MGWRKTGEFPWEIFVRDIRGILAPSTNNVWTYLLTLLLEDAI